MTSDRVYRAGIEERAARAELLRCAGHQFDSRVVATFLTILRGVRMGEDPRVAGTVREVEVA